MMGIYRPIQHFRNLRLLSTQVIAERGATAGGVDSSQTALFQKMGGSIDQIAQTTSFSGQRLLDGSYTGKQFEAGSAGAPSLSLDVASSLNGQSAGFDMAGLGLSGLDLSSASGAQDAVTRIDAAMAEVERQSGELDTFISDSRQASMSQLQTVSQTEMTRSPIRDSDMALESTLLTRSQLLAQVGSTGLQSLHQDVSAQQAMALLR